MKRLTPEPPPRRSLVPSGDHSAATTPLGRSVTYLGSPPLVGMTHACGLPPRSEMKSSRLPSGENRGRMSLASAVVSCWGSPPLQVVPQRRRAYLLFSMVRLT